MGVEVKHFVKCLGIRQRNIVEHEGADDWGFTQDHAFALALQEAFRRTKMVSALWLFLDERVFMLRSWILPVVSWVPQVFYAPEAVACQLKVAYHLTLAPTTGG